MNQNIKFEDRVLLKLHRQYSKDETVAMQSKKIEDLEKEISDLKYEIGVMRSEYQELDHAYNEAKKELKVSENHTKSLQKRQSDIDKLINQRTEKLQNKLKQTQKTMREWSTLYYTLLNKKE